MSQQSLYPGLNPNQIQMFPGLNHNMPPGYPPYGGMRHIVSMSHTKPYLGNSGSNSASNAQETVTLLIPSGSVGAIIGSRGSHIRNISRLAGASIRIHVSLFADPLTLRIHFSHQMK